MKKRTLLCAALLFLVSLLFLPASAVEVTDVYSADRLLMDIDVMTGIDIQKDSPDSRLSYVRLNLSFVPMETSTQSTVSLNAMPADHAEVDDESILYRFTDFTRTDVNYSAQVRSENTFPNVTEKVDFPLTPAGEMEAYTEPTELIDSDDSTIIKRANALAEGEDDLILLLSKMGTWVRKEVNYSLSTYTASATQPASWVLENREGVCDEITSLFIAFCRSLDIPARFVSGQAYTNFNEINDWGPHAWAEVHVPGHGWVPYDITYGQFGFIDASHIALKETQKADSSSFTYTWKGYNVGLQVDDLEMKTDVASREGTLEPLVDLELEAVKNPVGYGSYNLIKGTLKNRHEYYVMVTMNIARTSHLTIPEAPQEIVTLRPSETRELFWLVKVEDNLDEGYVYTMPVYIETLYNESERTVFTARDSAPTYTEDELARYADRMQTGTTSKTTREVALNCSQSAPWLYEGGSHEYRCRVRNLGNTYLPDADVCITVQESTECRNISLPIATTRHINFSIPLTGKGEEDVFFRLTSQDTEATHHLTTKVRDIPKVGVSSFTAPQKVTFNEEFLVEAQLKKRSYSDPQNLTIVFRDKERTLKTLESVKMTQDHTYRLRMKGSQLSGKNSTIRFEVTYHDAQGRSYTETRATTVHLTDITVIQHIILWMNAAQAWLNGLMSPLL